jgi:hypothetical protein
MRIKNGAIKDKRKQIESILDMMKKDEGGREMKTCKETVVTMKDERRTKIMNEILEDEDFCDTTLVYVDNQIIPSNDYIKMNSTLVSMHRDIEVAKRAKCASVRERNIAHHRNERDRMTRLDHQRKLSSLHRWESKRNAKTKQRMMESKVIA